ncbi:cytochrome P450 [Nocardia vaccinii]|uniref:cytochrome P450 n=1 Tax=Nocardia vaccinii TaxID=1822 RepID=UPI000834C889|nr:cytochrome P450 [Nocardia vaccinii]
MHDDISATHPSPTFDLHDDNVQSRLYSEYERLRARSRVARGEKYGGYYMLTRYEDVKSALLKPDQFISRQGVTIPPYGLPIPSIPIEADPPEHRDYRSLLMPLFRGPHIAQLAEHVTEVTEKLIDDFIEQGYADLKKDLCEVVPSKMTEEFLGLADGEWQTLRSFGPVLLQTSRDELLSENATAAKGLMEFFSGVLDRKRQDPGDDLLTLLVNGEIKGEPMSSDEILGMAIMVGEAGHATTIRALTSTFLYLGEDLELRRQLIDDLSRVPSLIDEILRLESPVQLFARTVAADMEFAGTHFTTGDRVGMLFGCANRDEDVFDHAHTVDLDRKPNPHLSFGVGIHRCIGEPLARAEMKVVIEQVLRRIPDYSINPDAKLSWTPGHARELSSLPVTFTAGARCESTVNS